MASGGYKDIEANSITSLVKAVTGLRATLEQGRFLWFRGVDTGRHTLLPKLLRDGKDSAAVFEREERLATRFRQRSIAYWPAGHPQNDWEHLFAMQHYGIPTRLLDWTENVFVAAYFALSSAPAKKKSGDCPVVWTLDPVAWNRSMPGLSEHGPAVQVLTTADEFAEAYRPQTTRKRWRSPVAIYGTHNSARIVAQRGTFVVWGDNTDSLEAHNKGHLRKIRLTGEREAMYQDLRFLGFTETMVYPELTYLATEISQAEGWR